MNSLIPDSSGEQAPAETTTEVETQQPSAETQQPASETEATFLFADGVVGEGETPDWFKSSKYKTVSAQAEAFSELDGKFGSFTGAPKDG